MPFIFIFTEVLFVPLILNTFSFLCCLSFIINKLFKLLCHPRSVFALLYLVLSLPTFDSCNSLLISDFALKTHPYWWLLDFFVLPLPLAHLFALAKVPVWDLCTCETQCTCLSVSVPAGKTLIQAFLTICCHTFHCHWFEFLRSVI